VRHAWVIAAAAGCGFDPGSGSTPVEDAEVLMIADADPNAPDSRPLPDAAPPDARPPDAMPGAPDAAPDAAPANCGAGYVTVPGTPPSSTYRPVDPNHGYTTAISTCQADGAHLAITEAPGEAAALWEFIHDSISYDTGFFRVGIDRIDTTGWEDIFGNPFTPSPWAGGEPDSEDCLLIGQGGEYWDWNCGSGQEYACECE
jgi:hypothetical protein